MDRGGLPILDASGKGWGALRIYRLRQLLPPVPPEVHYFTSLFKYSTVNAVFLKCCEIEHCVLVVNIRMHLYNIVHIFQDNVQLHTVKEKLYLLYGSNLFMYFGCITLSINCTIFGKRFSDVPY